MAIAQWDAKDGALTLHGAPAQGLFNSLDAPEVVDMDYTQSPFAIKNHEQRIKENHFAKCVALKERVTVGGDAVTYVLQSATCQINAPEGAVYR